MAKNNTDLMKAIEAKNGNGVPAERPETPSDAIGRYLQRPDVIAQIGSAVPKHVTPDRLARVALTAIRTNPTLLECSIPSLMACIMQGAQLGLEVGPLGHCYMVPFNRKVKGKQGEPDRWIKDVQFIIGYKGLIDLARRSGQIKEIAAHPIFERDKFQVRYGFESTLEHTPNFADRGQLIGFYAYAITTDGGRYCDVMTLAEVNAIRERSKSKDNGPWVTDYEQMGRKTVLRRLCKFLPMSIEVADAIGQDDERQFGNATEIALNVGPAAPQTVNLPAAEQALLPDAENYSEEELAALVAEPGAVHVGG